MKLLVGLAAAAAATYLLRSEKGKALVSGLDKQAGDFGRNLTKMAGDLLKKGTKYGTEGVN
jgi:hypothetical protein